MSYEVPDHDAQASLTNLFECGSVKVHLEVFCRGWAPIDPRASANCGLERYDLVSLVILSECLLCIRGDLADWIIFISGSKLILAIPHCLKDHGKQIDVFSFIMKEFDESEIVCTF